MQAAPPMHPAMRVLRASFACLLALALVFSLTMAIWGDLRDALFVRIVDSRHAKSFVIRAPVGAKVWLGYQFLGLSAYPAIVDAQPEAMIDGVIATEPRAYASEKDFLKHATLIEPGANVAGLVAKLAEGRKLLHSGSEIIAGPGEFIPLLMQADGEVDAACLCSLEIPQPSGTSLLFAFLLRIEHEDARCFSGGTTSIGSTQLYAPEGQFWTVREEVEGLPRNGLRGQMRTSWRLHPQLLEPAAQAEHLRAHGVADPRWVALPEKSR